jgi:hypothetical protein
MRAKIRRSWVKFRNKILLSKDEVKLLQIGAITALELNRSAKFRTSIKGTTFGSKIRKIVNY